MTVHVESASRAVEDGVDMSADQRGGSLAEERFWCPGHVVRQAPDVVAVVVYDDPPPAVGSPSVFRFQWFFRFKDP
jgi:hypothetical protein